MKLGKLVGALVLIAVVAVIVLALGIGLGTNGFHNPFDNPKPVLGMGGGCTTDGGTLKGVGTGFDPNTLYKTSVKYPDGTVYEFKNYYGYGASDEFGVVRIEWPCKGDDAGQGYTITVAEVGHNRSASTKFSIDTP